MKKTRDSPGHHKLLWPALLFGTLVLSVGEAGVQAQGAGEPTGPPAISPLSPTAPPELVKPALPLSDINNAEAVFRKLDAAKRGYVTLEDTKDLIGFGEAFRVVDTKDSGKLTLRQFRKAWSIYRSKK